MKKISPLLVAATLCLSIGARAETHVSAGNKCGAWVAKFVKAQKEHDLDGFVSLFAKDYISFQPLGPQFSFRGADTVRTHWQGLFALGMKQTGTPDFKPITHFCAEEKQADGSTKVLLAQTWQGGFDARGENPCISLPNYGELNVKDGLARRATIYFAPTAYPALMACLPQQPATK
jgi:ketosteroid isomerase-like protein